MIASHMEYKGFWKPYMPVQTNKKMLYIAESITLDQFTLQTKQQFSIPGLLGWQSF